MTDQGNASAKTSKWLMTILTIFFAASKTAGRLGVFKSLVNHAGYQFIDARLGELRTIYNDNYMAADGCIRGLRDKPLHIDVTIANPTGPSYLHNASKTRRN